MIESGLARAPNTRFVHPLSSSSSTPFRKKIVFSGQLLVPWGNYHKDHWLVLCVDFDNRVYSVVGGRTIPQLLYDYIDNNSNDLAKCRDTLAKFGDISPPHHAQEEAECGARVAVYCVWFAKQRQRNLQIDSLDQATFVGEVVKQMQKWRRARQVR